MLKYILFICLFLNSFSSNGSPKVPTYYEFAGIKLVINENARKQIQKDVDALHINQNYLRQKIEKVDLFFPIIERVFREENLPDDFKYLTIQESALISDAVSSSNAIGFWQFKEASAREVGLRVDRYIDERMHITASSHAAAKYLKKNNFFFDNWIYALLAYNTGPTGAEKYVEKQYIGKKKMDITGRTHWYVKKFLAHKIAFEKEINKSYTPSLKIIEFDNLEGKSLNYLSDYFSIEHQTLMDYNKWWKAGKTTSGESNVVIIPVTKNDLLAQSLLNIGFETTNKLRKYEPKNNHQQSKVEKHKPKIVVQKTYATTQNIDWDEHNKFPIINTTKSNKVKINGIPGFVASRADNFNSITIKYGILKDKFLKYNDMTPYDKIIEEQVYYLKSKKSKAKTHYHVLIPGESAWSISQKYGIKLNKLLVKNRMREEKDLRSGMVMWLRFIRPADVTVEYKEVRVQSENAKNSPKETQQLSTIPPKNDSNTLAEPKANQQYQNFNQIEEKVLFEKLNEDTGFIDENSYVDLKKIPENTILDKSGVKISVNNYNQRENVNKVELSHIVKSGETLFSISRTYGVSIGELRQWNDIEDLDLISVGQRLTIIKVKQTNDQNQNSYSSLRFQTHTVKKEDTFYSIAREYGVSIKELMELNEKDDFTINEGEELKIKAIK